MNVQVKKVYRNYYLNIISALFKKLGLPQLIDHLVPVDPQCQTRVSDAVQAILYNVFDAGKPLFTWNIGLRRSIVRNSSVPISILPG